MKDAGNGPGVLFVTGTGTGVGKTVLVLMLGAYLKSMGARYRLLKPVSTGGRSDPNRLMRQQGRQVSIDDINPLFFSLPAAPWVAACVEGRTLAVTEILDAVKRSGAGVDYLVVEGVGGVMVPFNKNECVLDLAQRLDGTCVVVAQNKLGVMNEVLLSVRAMRSKGLHRIVVVLFDPTRRDESYRGNASYLRILLPKVEILTLKRVNVNELYRDTCNSLDVISKKTLARLTGFASFSPLFNRTEVGGLNSAKKRLKSR